MTNSAKVSVVIPARNESASVAGLVTGMRKVLSDAEIIVVDDGSSDDTADLAERAGARVIRHPYGKGNGAAIKTGARAASGDVLVFMDGDGQHDPADTPSLLAKFDEGYDLVVGARELGSQANPWRATANWIYSKLASWIVGHRIPDLTSGFRAARAERFREFLDLYPNGFSCPTTSTMAFFRTGYNVAYVPVRVGRRTGRSHLRVLQDGGRFFVIIFRIGTLYSPLKLFAPVAVFLFMAGGLYYAYTYLTQGRFTNFGALLFLSSVIVFMIGLVSEQIASLVFLQRKRE